jgi:hypothetical protein
VGWLLYALALAPRLYVALAWAREPVWDGHYYHIGARSIAAGLGYAGAAGAPWCHYPVGYPAVLGAAYRLFGAGQATGPVLNALLGAALAPATYLLARHATSEARARIAGAVVALHPGLIVYAALLMTEPLAALGLSLAALVAFRGARGGLVGSGLLLGLATLVRPQSILCAPLSGWLARAEPHRKGARWRAAALATAVALAVVAPWTVRNCIVMDGCAFVSTNTGWNLAIGAVPRATGRFVTLAGTDGCPVVTGQVQQDRCWLGVGLAAIGASPWRWLSLAPQKLAHTFDHESFPIGYLATADPERWPAERHERARGLLSLAHRLLVLLAPLGLCAWPGRGRRAALAAVALAAWLGWRGFGLDDHPFWPLALLTTALALLPRRLADPIAPARGRPVLRFCALNVGLLCLVHVVFFGEDRYHLVVSPLLAILAASALGRPHEGPAAR